MKHVLITGGFGYVGGRLVQRLLADGYGVRVSSRRPAAQIPDWAKQQAGLSWGHDIFELAAGVSAVVHLAAPNEIAAAASPQDAIRDTVALTSAAAEAALEAGAERFVYMSTVHVYGSPLEGTLSEATVPAPGHPYAEAHLRSEQETRDRLGKQTDYLIVRLSNGFGVPADPQIDRWSLLINDLCRQASVNRRMQLASAGTQLRDFIPLDDVVDVLTQCIHRETLDVPDRLMNLASGESVSVLEMAERIRGRASVMYGEQVSLSAPADKSPQPVPELRIDTTRLKNAGFALRGRVDQELDALLKFCQVHFPQQAGE